MSTTANDVQAASEEVFEPTYVEWGCVHADQLAPFVTATKMVCKSRKAILTCVHVGSDGSLTCNSLDHAVQQRVEWINSPRYKACFKHADVETLVKAAKGHYVAFKSCGTSFVAEFGHNSMKMESMDTDEFPSFPDCENATMEMMIEREPFVKSCKALFPCVDTEITRYALSAIMLSPSADSVDAVCTDGRRLAFSAFQNQLSPTMPGLEVLIPSQAMKIVAKLATSPYMVFCVGGEWTEIKEPNSFDRRPVRMDGSKEERFTANFVVIRTGDVTHWIRLVDGRFPKWKDCIDIERRICGTTGANKMTQALKSLKCYAESPGVNIEASQNGLLTLKTSASTAITTHGGLEGLKTRLDKNFLLEFFESHHKSETVTWVFESPSKAVQLISNVATLVIMPMSQ